MAPIKSVNTQSDINTAQPGYSSLAWIAMTSFDWRVDHDTEKNPVSL